MAILDIFKKKKPAKSPQERPIKRVESPKFSPQGGEARQVRLGGKKISGEAYKILVKPHVTEKATDLTKKNQYTFNVFPRSNKNQIKRAIEDVYGIDVVSVRIINVPRKRRRLGRIEGWSSGHKKAIVKIKEGQKIEVLPR